MRKVSGIEREMTLPCGEQVMPFHEQGVELEGFIRAGFAVVTLERVVGIGSDEEGVGFGASETFDVVFYLRRVVRHNGWTNREVW